MDLATIVGIIGAFVLIIGAIIAAGSPLVAFFDIPSILIVIGGTTMCCLVCERMVHVKNAMKVAANAFQAKELNVHDTIIRIVELSNIARREGVLALENQEVDDAFLAKGMRMAADGLPQDEIRDTLSAELVSMKERHTRGQDFFKFIAGTAPSMGMIGTLIGLVAMLRSLDDPSTIGPAMAVALLTTMYGAVIAFVVAAPIAEKLDRRTKEETMNMIVVIDGIESIVKGMNANIIKEKLEARIAPGDRNTDEQAA